MSGRTEIKSFQEPEKPLGIGIIIQNQVMLLKAGTFTVFAAVKQSLQEETVHFCKSLNNWIKTEKIFRKTACLNFSLFLVQMQEIKAHIYLKKIIILVGQRPPNSLFHSSFFTNMRSDFVPSFVSAFCTLL